MRFISQTTFILKLSALLLLNPDKFNAQQNTILIIADDVSPDYFGFISPATDTANTPNIRALAKRGVTFTKVWSAPVCSPARAGILTGRYPFRTGVGGVITNAASPQIDTTEMSIAKLLKYYAPLKYNTACIGKWHLNNNLPAKRSNPNKLGFDLYSGNFNGAIPNYYNYQRIKNGILDTVTQYATTQTVNDAIAWIDTMNTARPFFLWLAFNAPHDPYHMPPASLCTTVGLTGTAADISANPKKYFKAALEALDTETGRLFDYLTQKNMLDSTNIIFIGDNGNQSQVVQGANPNKAKGTIYDYGVRVPMVVAGPAVLNGNRSSSSLVNTPDIFATIAELCRFQNWKNFMPPGKLIDTRSFMPILKNQTNTARSWIFSETYNTPVTADDGKTIRNNDFHLLRFDNGSEEFYNQTADVFENNNLLLGPLSATELSNYHQLCDSISALTGMGSCPALSVVDLVAEALSLHLYPNPMLDQVLFELTGVSGNSENSFELMNALGQVIVARQCPATTCRFEVQSLPTGVYYGIACINGRKLVSKIVKD